VWSRSPGPAQALATQHGVPAYDDFDELLDRCDAVVFAVPPAVQPDLAVAAARRGKALLLERPIAHDIAGAEELAAAVESSHVISQTALTWRYASAVRRFLKTDAPKTRPQGGAGRLITGQLAKGSGASPWRIERGVLNDQGADLIDLLDAALGPVVAMRAHGDPRGWVGIMMDHQIGRYSEASLYATSTADYPDRSGVEVFGPGGFAQVDGAASVGPLTYETMFREFAEAIEQGRAHELDVRHGLRLQRVIEAAETDLVVGR
jgi:predicted dehydrogenase